MIQDNFVSFFIQPYFYLKCLIIDWFLRLGLFACLDVNNFPSEDVHSSMNWRFSHVEGK